MKPPDPANVKRPSLADYLVRYDLQAMIDEAQQDYKKTSAGTPRLLDQKEIAARFRGPRTSPSKPAS